MFVYLYSFILFIVLAYTSFPSNMYKPVTHIIFDMDGLLLNTEDLYTEAFQSICSKYGKTYDWSVKLHIMGMKPDPAIKYVIDTLDLPLSVEEFKAKVMGLLDEIFSKAKLMPGADALVNHMKTHGVPIAICTGSSSKAFKAKTSHLQDFFSLFEVIVIAGDDQEVKYGKPHPDAYLVTLSRFNPPPRAEQVLVFEDAPNGVESALAANMQVVMVPDVKVPAHLTSKATLRLNSLEKFDPELFGLPPFKSIVQ